MSYPYSEAGSSKTMIIAVLLIVLIGSIGIYQIYFQFGDDYIFITPTATTTTSTTTTTTPITTVPPTNDTLSGPQIIVLLSPMTGALSAFGASSASTARYAQTQVNTWLASRNKTWFLDLYVEDTAAEPTQAEAKMTVWHDHGAEIFIGPMSNGECSQLKLYADSNGLLLVSPSSTAISLSIPGDSIFRFCPDNFVQGPAIAAMLLDAGITNVVATWRGDAWGDGIKAAVEDAYGDTFAAYVEYTPATDFSAEVQSLANAVQAALDGGATADEVAVLAISFEEIIPYMEAADEHPVLKTVQWFGSDGTCLLSSLADHPIAGPFADTVNFTNPLLTSVASERHDDVKSYVESQIGRVPDTYCYITYDITWLLALALDSIDEYSATEAKIVLPDLVENYYGASGNFTLNENGDRAVADYALWAVAHDGISEVWAMVGVYLGNSGAIEWE